jgi:hypothetical protein
MLYCAGLKDAMVNAGAALGLCLAAAAPVCAETIDSTYSDFDSRACVHKRGHAVEDYGEWRCKGLGMLVLLSAGDQRMTMSFGKHAADEPAAAQTLAGFNDVYKARIEWRYVRAAGGAIAPFAAIVPWNTSHLDESDDSLARGRPRTFRGKVLVVTRLGPQGVCHVGYVDALANRDADALARTIADRDARAFRCATDKPVILGETGPGFSSSSDAEKR